jgi:hypothetical protein
LDAYSFNTGNGQDAVAGLSADRHFKVGPWDKKGWWDAYEASSGCCDKDYREGA